MIMDISKNPVEEQYQNEISQLKNYEFKDFESIQE
jgi:hypothetical protein